MPRILLVLAGAFVALAWPVALHAASFRCGPYVSRGQCPEALICTEQNLSRLDDAMASLYETARGRIQSGLLTGFRDYQKMVGEAGSMWLRLPMPRVSVPHANRSCARRCVKWVNDRRSAFYFSIITAAALGVSLQLHCGGASRRRMPSRIRDLLDER